MPGPDRSELGHRHLEVGEHLEQERLELGLGLVDLVDQQHDGRLGLDGLQERTRGQEAEREKRVLLAGDLADGVRERRGIRDQLADALAKELRVEELLGILPFVQRLAFVEAFVTLQANQGTAGEVGQRLGQLGLAHAGGAFDEDRAVHPRGQVDDGGDAPARDVPGGAEPLLDLLDRLEH